jgi:hypothetical protein
MPYAAGQYPPRTGSGPHFSLRCPSYPCAWGISSSCWRANLSPDLVREYCRAKFKFDASDPQHWRELWPQELPCGETFPAPYIRARRQPRKILEPSAIPHVSAPVVSTEPAVRLYAVPIVPPFQRICYSLRCRIVSFLCPASQSFAALFPAPLVIPTSPGRPVFISDWLVHSKSGPLTPSTGQSGPLKPERQ